MQKVACEGRRQKIDAVEDEGCRRWHVKGEGIRQSGRGRVQEMVKCEGRRYMIEKVEGEGSRQKKLILRGRRYKIRYSGRWRMQENVPCEGRMFKIKWEMKGAEGGM